MVVWELIGIVILVAVFFGISFSAALHGIISFVLWASVIGVVLYGIVSLFANSSKTADVPQNKIQASPVPRKITKETEPIKIPSFVKWLTFFIISYLITLLFMTAIGLSEMCIKYNVPIWVDFSIPALPFILVLVISLIKNGVQNKKRAPKKTR